MSRSESERAGEVLWERMFVKFLVGQMGKCWRRELGSRADGALERCAGPDHSGDCRCGKKFTFSPKCKRTD